MNAPSVDSVMLQSYKKDAERYRWLRVNWRESADMWWDHGQTPEQLDTMIDRAMEK